MDSKENILLRSQAANYVQAVAEVFYAILQKCSPLDNELKKYFRMHGECGVRDRYNISECCFSLFRWYGWLRSSLPGGLPANPHKSINFCRGLAAALWLENHDDLPFFANLIKYSNIDSKYMTPAPDNIKGKMKGLGHFFKIRKLNILQLIPEWFVQILPVDTDVESMIEYLQRRPPVWIRTRNKTQVRVKEQLKQRDVDFTEHPQCPNAIKITTPAFRANIFKGYGFGDFEIQDLASQCIGLVCQAQEGEKWWDVCAGAGGKSLLLSDEMRGKGSVVATDIRDKILIQLGKRAKRVDDNNIRVNDLDLVCATEELFDGVLVDAPCSCTGIWRRSPDLKWTTNAGACKTYSKTQLEICKMASEKVKVGGFLIYGTCSLSVQENEDVIEEFLKRNNHFQLSDFVDPLSGESVHGMLRIKFSPYDNDGMFVARLRRQK